MNFSSFTFVLTAVTTATLCTAVAEPFAGELTAPSTLHSGLIGGKKYVIEVGFEYLHPMFQNFSNIVIENPTTSSNSSTVTGDVKNDYPDAFAQTLKFQMLLDEKNRTSLSVKSYLPLNALSQLDTGYIYLPEYVLYRAEAQRPRIQVGLGSSLSDQMRVGLGADIGFSVSANANVFLQNGSGKYSDQRISAKLKPTVVPQASLQVSDYQFVIRAENKSKMDLTTNGGARVFSGGAGVDFTYNTESALFFDPWSFELHGKSALSSKLNLTYGVAYQLWSRYQARAAIIANDIQNNCNGNAGCSTVFSKTLTPSFTARNLFVPQVGIEILSGDDRFEVGYRFKDSIFAGVPTGTGNYLDPPRHDFWFGATFVLKNGWEWGADLQVSQLVAQTVVKLSSGDIGGPGYTTSGFLIGGGAKLVVPF
ncbi:MAG: hypothetical protein JST80_08965 [Bdellovibrionales bacterium]|nr:hypothetical protein [Bdellovibrionales bacterium]